MITESSLLANTILLLYTVSCNAAWLSCFRYRGHSFAEAAAYALMATIMVQAWSAQVLLMAGWPCLNLPVLLLCAVVAVYRCITNRGLIIAQFVAFIQFVRNHQLATTGLLLAWGYAAVVCIFSLVQFKVQPMDEYLPIWNHAHSILSIWSTAPDMVLPVLNHAIFSASWQPTLTIALANIGAYTAIGLCTYALARRYAWPPMAITVTVLVISMPRVLHQGLTTPSELLPAAAALVAILALYRMCEQPHGRDLIMLSSSIAYSVAGGRLCYLMPAVLCALSLVALGRRHSMTLWRQDVSRRWQGLLAMAAVLMVFSQAGAVGANLVAGKPWIGEFCYNRITFNLDAHLGLVGNLARYLFLSFDLPDALDRLVEWTLGFSLLGVIKGLYQWLVAASLGARGAAVTFDWVWTPDPEFSWFGPVGFFLVMPSVGLALLRGPRRLKSTALAMVVYWILIALITAWQPENVRLMTPFFICSGFFMAFLLPPWRIGRNGQRVLQVLSILLLVHAILNT